ncbi:MAG: hypothetical protein J6M19_00640 [Bacteroidaceae bacterium]|nr:hypothetical protein [Bacteroidaceae bacterium]
MKKLDFKRILCTVAYLSLAGFSCFWTAESLFIWQPSITIFGAWLIAIVFYAVASICFSMFIKSLEKNAKFGKGVFSSRGGQMFWGIAGLLIFWLLISLPTNTHTLLYRASIKNVLTTDLNRTQGYLQGLKNNNIEIKKINDEYDSKKSEVEAILLRMLAEIDRPGAEGIGPMFKTALAELETVLGENFQKQLNIGTNRAQWLTTLYYYQEQAYKLLGKYRSDCDKKIANIEKLMNSRVLDNLIRNGNIALDDVDKMKVVNHDVIEAAVGDLKNSYSYIKTNSQYIEFKDGDKERYTRDGAIPEAQTMLSVPDVWRDYLTTDKYSGHGFIWWVLLSLLVDLAAFIFANKSFN